MDWWPLSFVLINQVSPFNFKRVSFKRPVGKTPWRNRWRFHPSWYIACNKNYKRKKYVGIQRRRYADSQITRVNIWWLYCFTSCVDRSSYCNYVGLTLWSRLREPVSQEVYEHQTTRDRETCPSMIATVGGWGRRHLACSGKTHLPLMMSKR